MMGTQRIETAVGAGGLAALGFVLLAGLFIGLTPGAYLAGPAVLGYMHVSPDGRRATLIRRAAAYVVGAASLTALQRFRRLIPLGLSAQRIAGWLLLATAAFYLLQVVLIRTGRSALFA